MRLPPRLLLPIGVLALGAVLATLIVVTRDPAVGEPPPPPIPLVRTVTVELEDVRHRVRTHGTVAPRTESDLTPEVSGRVTWVSPNLVSGGFFLPGPL